MNLRAFTFALLVSSLPSIALAGAAFDRSDFKSARVIHRGGKELVSVKLSKSGKAKVRKLKQDEKVHSEIGGVTYDFRLRVPIRGDGLEMGPYSGGEAKQVAAAINGD